MCRPQPTRPAPGAFPSQAPRYASTMGRNPGIGPWPTTLAPRFAAAVALSTDVTPCHSGGGGGCARPCPPDPPPELHIPAAEAAALPAEPSGRRAHLVPTIPDRVHV